MKNLRIGITGPSGSGKTTLARALSSRLSVTIGYWGSRDTARSLGFSLPYDTDTADLATYHAVRADGGLPEEAAKQAMAAFKPGCKTVRGLFQDTIRSGKANHEASLDAFASDRTFLDDAVYSELASGSRDRRSRAILATAEGYDVIFHMPSTRFQLIGDDLARLDDAEYQAQFEEILERLISRVRNQPKGAEVITLTKPGKADVYGEAMGHLIRLGYID